MNESEQIKGKALIREPLTAALRKYVRSIWSYVSSQPTSYEYILPTTREQLLINLAKDELVHWDRPGEVGARAGGIALQGALTHRVLIDSDQKRDICGVAFAVGGAAAFHRFPASHFANRLVGAEEIWGADAPVLRASLLDTHDAKGRLDAIEAFLAARLHSRPSEDNLLERAVGLLADGATIGLVRAECGLSQRAIHALFARRVGLRPKLYARVERFGAILDAVPSRPNWSHLAVENAYADQAHLVREFGVLAGTTPSRHRPVDPYEARHAPCGPGEIFKTPRDESA